MKHYKKFYEIGNNSYYKITADDDLYIATESFLKLGKKGLFKKEDRLTQGFKLLKVSPAVATLFNAVANMKKKPGQKDVTEDMIQYKELNHDDISESIRLAYESAFTDASLALDKWYRERAKELKEKYENGEMSKDTLEFCLVDNENKIEQHKAILNKNNPLKNGEISLTKPTHTGSKIVRAMMNSNLNHLYSESVNAFAKNIFIYEVDMFGTLTIYRIMEVKGVIKSCDSFVYNKKLIEEFLKNIYEEERGK